MVRSRPALGMAGLMYLTLTVAFITSFLALEAGSVSLASAVMATRSLLVLLWAVLGELSLSQTWLPGEQWRGLPAKGAAAVLVTAGVGAMALP